MLDEFGEIGPLFDIEMTDEMAWDHATIQFW